MDELKWLRPAQVDSTFATGPGIANLQVCRDAVRFLKSTRYRRRRVHFPYLTTFLLQLQR